MISLVYWALLGAIAGGVAKAIVPANVPAGWIPTIGVGVLGSIAGGLPFGQGPAGVVGSIVGACVVLYLYRLWSESDAT
jgi:uncharacterized membrane protein YeaQ/YmgE (transglycosylase-associated protein family)